MAQLTKLQSTFKETLTREFTSDLDEDLDPSQEKWTIELKRGNSVVYKEDRSNAITTTTTYGFFILPYAILTNFKNLGTLFFFAVTLIMLIDPDLSPYSRWIMAFPLLIYMIIHVGKVCFIAYIRRKQDEVVNNNKTRRAKPSGELEENIKWMDLKPGDIVYLKKEEMCPADLILLDTSLPKNRDMICWLNTQGIDGFSDLTMKKATQATKVENGSTRKGNYPEYRKLLSGKIEYDPPNALYRSFAGYVKLKKDPRAEPITNDNFIPRGAVLKNTEWIYGIVAYTGNDTKTMFRSRRPIEKGNYFDDLAEKFFVFGIFLVLILAAICIIIFTSKKNDPQLKLEFPEGIEGKRFFTNVILFAPVIPIAIYAMFDLIMAIRSILLERKFNAQRNNPDIKILDQSALPNLGHVDYCLLDKTGTLTNANYRIRDIYTKSRFYQVDFEKLSQKVKIQKGNTKVTFMQTISNEKRAHTVPTLQEVGEEGGHMQSDSPSKAYKFKDDIEANIRLTSPDRLNTSSSPINKKQDTGAILLFGKRTTQTEEDQEAVLSPLQENLHTEQGLLTEGADENKTPAHFETQESVRPLFSTAKKEQEIELITKHKRDNTEPESLKKIDPPSPYSPNKNPSLSYLGTTPRNDERNFLKEKLNENQYLHDCYVSHDRDVDQFARCLALCHAARSKYTDEKYVYESSHPEDIPLLELGALSGKSFMVSNRPDNPSKYTVLEEDKVYDYKILGVNDFSYGRKRFSIVTKAGENEPAIIYAKGTAFGMKSALQLDELEQTYFDALVNRLQKKGYKVVVLAGRELESEESDNFYKKYQSCKMSLYSQTDELESLAKEVETRLKLIGVVALEDELRPDAIQTVQTLKQADIKTWMVTGDNQENAMNICYLSRLINKDTEVFNCTFDNVENAKALIRTTLNNIKKHYSDGELDGPSGKVSGFKTIYTKKFDFAVSIDGESLDLVFSDKYVKANFTFLCALANSVIGYRLSPSNKTALISMIKRGFKGSPTVLAVGDGHNDKLMLERADISLELKANNDVLPVNAGDIQIKSLSVIKELLLVDGRDISDKTEKVLHFMFYKSLVLGFPLFLFSLDSASTGSPLFDYMFIFLYSFLFTFVPTLVYGTCDRGEDREVLLAFPALYLDGKIKKGRAWLNFLIQSLVEGIIHGIVVYEIVTYAVLVTLSKEGYTPDFYMSSVIQYYALVTIVNLKLYGYFKTRKMIWAGALIVSLISLLVYMFINEAAQFVDNIYTHETQAIFQRGGSILVLFFVIVFCAMISRLVKYIVAERWFRSWYNYYGSKTYEEAEQITNEKILASAVPQKDLGTIVKSAFKQTELMDPVVQQMLHPADESLNELGIRPWTLGFVDSRMEKQYKLVMAKIVGKKFKYIYFILLIIYAGYIIGESIVNEEQSYTFSRLGVWLAFLVLGFTLFSNIYRHYYFEVTFIFVILVFAAKIAFDWTTDYDSSLGAALIPAAVSIVFNAYAFWVFLANLAYYVVYIIRLIVLYTTNDYVEHLEQTKFITFYSLWSFALLIGAITVLISILTYKFEKHQRSEHLANTKVGLQLTKTNDILSILLPKFIKEKISRLGDDKSLAEDQGEVTILFCDIMDFDKIIQYEGKHLVQILDHVFRAFDQLCGTYGVQKIETVGKTYMACAGLKSCEMGVAKEIVAVHQTRRILNLALDMDEFVKKVTYSNGIPMKLRIGVHYGRVIAGVIGYHKPQFSLIGDAVNTTSRVCTSKNPGQIRMSNEAYQKMMEAGGAGRSEIFFIPKTEEMKGKGDVKVHIVTRKATNTGFKKMIANAVKVNKDKHVFAVEEAGGLNSERKTMNNPNMFKDIKGNLLLQKEKIQEELRKAEAENEGGKKSEHDDDSDSDGYADEDQDLALLKPNPLTLRFASTANNRMIVDFEQKLDSDQRLFSIRSILAFLAIYLIQTALFIAINDQYDGSFEAPAAIIALRFIFAVALAILLIFYGSLTKRKRREPFALVTFLFGTLTTILHGAWTLNNNYEFIEGVELMLIHSIAIHAGGLNFVDSLRLTGGMTVTFFVAFGVKDHLRTRIIFFFCLFSIINLIHKYVKLTEEIKFYNNLRLRERKKVEQSRLVGQLLPLHAAEIYFSDPTGRVDVSDEFHDVTILYADIKGFTDYSAEVEPKDVVTMLSALFTRFDKVCVKYSLYKVYTIGDCYVALSFFDASRRDPGKEVNNMVQMALSMIGIIREVRKEIKFDGLDMRIGLHTGTIIGGIVGTDIVRYDIWGRDCLIANAMESEGVKGNINVSHTTRNLLEATYPGVYRFEPHKVVEMEKIQAKVPCYLLYSNDAVLEQE